eukprot:TRINITY_DN66105_c13_g1_i4.p1 TRINITY_DN66105_c13_g1~~TRINITY_DN66105_c13_g1_i4.p1  ORF type:complete len:135 (-),score=6.63 TRINITY_DN66105_c13_g1_i4:160-564(-)
MSGKGNDQDKTGVDESLKTLMGQECTVAQEFITKYYKALDHPQRNTPGGMAQVVEFYDGSANLVWNGHGVKHEGTQIQNLLQSLPQTNHDITSIDCQPVAGGDCVLTASSCLCSYSQQSYVRRLSIQNHILVAL